MPDIRSDQRSDQRSAETAERDARSIASRGSGALLRALLPTRSGFALLLSLGLIIWGIAHWIFWVLDHVPEGSDYQPPSPSVTQEVKQIRQEAPR